MVGRSRSSSIVEEFGLNGAHSPTGACPAVLPTQEDPSRLYVTMCCVDIQSSCSYKSNTGENVLELVNLTHLSPYMSCCNSNIPAEQITSKAIFSLYEQEIDLVLLESYYHGYQGSQQHQPLSLQPLKHFLRVLHRHDWTHHYSHKQKRNRKAQRLVKVKQGYFFRGNYPTNVTHRFFGRI